MNNWAVYPAFIATCLSMWLWLRFVRAEHDSKAPMTLSELGTSKNSRYFRAVLWICGPLFGVTILFYIAPRLDNIFVIVPLIGTVALEILTGVFLPRGKVERALHEVSAYGMAFFMLTSVIATALVIPRFAWIQWVLAVLMFSAAFLAIISRNRFIYYELCFIFLSHITILVAALAVR